jgi:glutathione synthase/RimK-type ligase-like ATP-grasp enzyme
VVNRPASMASNNSKPYQLELIRACGLSVPETIITTDPDVVMAFWKKHQDVIYKSVSSQRSIVARLRKSDIDRLPEVACCPTQFQRFIKGTDYRVHVLENKVFSSRIVSEADDYRYSAETTIISAPIPTEVAAKCILLTEKLGLLFSGIDLRLSDNGEWFCFEANASPGYTCFADEGARITPELAGFLAGK